MTVPGDTGGWNRDKLQATLAGGYRTVIGVFPSVDDARSGLERLHSAGFDRDMLSLVTRGTDAAAEIPSQAASDQASSSSLAGALGGGVVGGVLGGLVGAGLLAIPGAGPLLAAGWLASALGGAAVGAGAGGWIASVAGLGVPKDLAAHYKQLVEQGNFLVMVLAKEGEQVTTAERLLDEADARDIASYRYQAHPEAFPGSESPAEDHPQ